MPQSLSTQEVYAFMEEREVKACALYRFVAGSVADPEAKALLERLAQRCEAFLEKLAAGRKEGSFTGKPCALPDRAYCDTILDVPKSPGQSLPEILMFAIKVKQDGYRLCRESAQKSQASEVKRLWSALAEEERTSRLELESYYEKEIINRI